MKQKYSILKDNQTRQLIIREFAELDKETLSLLCEETYESKMIMTAIKAGKEVLVATLRTNNLYPPGKYVDKIADTVIGLYGSKDKESIDLFFDDVELLTREPEQTETEEEVAEESTDLEELLEDDFNETYEDTNAIKKLDSSIKIADDDSMEVDDES